MLTYGRGCFTPSWLYNKHGVNTFYIVHRTENHCFFNVLGVWISFLSSLQMAEEKQTIMGCSFAQTSYGWKEIKMRKIPNTKKASNNLHALHQIRSEWYKSFSSKMKQMSKCTFTLGFQCWCLVVLLQTEVSSWLLSPKSKRKPVSNYSELWYKTQCLPELFVGWCNLHSVVCSSLCLKTTVYPR